MILRTKLWVLVVLGVSAMPWVASTDALADQCDGATCTGVCSGFENGIPFEGECGMTTKSVAKDILVTACGCIPSAYLVQTTSCIQTTTHTVMPNPVVKTHNVWVNSKGASPWAAQQQLNDDIVNNYASKNFIYGDPVKTDGNGNMTGAFRFRGLGGVLPLVCEDKSSAGCACKGPCSASPSPAVNTNCVVVVAVDLNAPVKQLNAPASMTDSGQPETVTLYPAVVTGTTTFNPGTYTCSCK